MHATSAVAVAIVAAAGALAVPMSSGIFARGTTFSPATLADSSLAAPGNAPELVPSTPVNENTEDRALPTVTVFYPPKATMCKPGEAPSVERKNHNKSKGSNYDGGHKREGARHRGDHALPVAPALGARSDAPIPMTPVSGLAGSAPTPTNHPKNKHGSKSRQRRTKTGADGTVTVFHKGSSTPCYAAPTGVPAGEKFVSIPKDKAHHKKHKKASSPEAVLSQPEGTANQASAPGGNNNRTLVEHTVDLLERYFNELDELD